MDDPSSRPTCGIRKRCPLEKRAAGTAARFRTLARDGTLITPVPQTGVGPQSRAVPSNTRSTRSNGVARIWDPGNIDCKEPRMTRLLFVPRPPIHLDEAVRFKRLASSGIWDRYLEHASSSVPRAGRRNIAATRLRACDHQDSRSCSSPCQLCRAHPRSRRRDQADRKWMLRFTVVRA